MGTIVALNTVARGKPVSRLRPGLTLSSTTPTHKGGERSHHVDKMPQTYLSERVLDAASVGTLDSRVEQQRTARRDLYTVRKLNRKSAQAE